MRLLEVCDEFMHVTRAVRVWRVKHTMQQDLVSLVRTHAAAGLLVRLTCQNADRRLPRLAAAAPPGAGHAQHLQVQRIQKQAGAVPRSVWHGGDRAVVSGVCASLGSRSRAVVVGVEQRRVWGVSCR